MTALNDFVSDNLGLIVLIDVVVFIGLLVWLFILNRNMQQARQHYQMLMEDVNHGNLEQILNKLFSRLDQLGSNVNHLGTMQQNMRTQLATTLQKVAVIRFNPFEDTGGDQSFAIAMLDEQDNGVVLSSLHARESTRVYVKPIQSGRSSYTLADEEKEVLVQAIGEQ